MTYDLTRQASPSLVFRFAALLVAGVFLSGCGSDDGSSASKKSKYEVAGDEGLGGEGTMGLPGADGPGAFAPSAPAVPGAYPPSGQGGPSPGGGSMAGAPTQPSSTPPGGVNPYQVTGETPQELLAFIQKMMNTQPRGVTRAEQISSAQNILNAVIQAAEKILGQPSEAETRVAAAGAKVTALTQMAQMGVGTADQQLLDFCNELKKDDQPEVARLGQRMSFAQAMDDFAQGEDEGVAQLLESFKTLFSEETKDQQALMFGNTVIGVFEQSGFKDEALDVLKCIVDAFADASEQKLVDAVAQLKERGSLIELDLNNKMSAYMRGQPDAIGPLTEGLYTLLESEGRGATALSVAREIGVVCENRDPDVAGQIYTRVVEAFKDHPELAAEAKKTADKYQRRSTIVGQPFAVEGINLDGSPFDWNAYSGKVVLVDFWATWCLPCLQEIPNIKENYDRYRDQGFEVVGVNLDDERQRVQQMMSVQPLPWPTVVSPDANAVGFDSPLAVKCGLEAIPFLVLVDRDGTAIAVNLRGAALTNKLAEVFAKKPAP